MFLGSSCCNIAENSTFARPLDFACRLNPSFHAFAEACATETLGIYMENSKRLPSGGQLPDGITPFLTLFKALSPIFSFTMGLAPMKLNLWGMAES